MFNAPTIWALAHKAWNASLTAEDAWAGWAAGEFELEDNEVRAHKMYVNISHAWFLNYG